MTLKLVIGPMFSGKTSYNIDVLSTHSDSFRVLYINSLQDTRVNGVLSSRDGVKESFFPKVTFKKLRALEDVGDISDFDYILIDEGQFFPDLTKVIEWVDCGKFVTVVGLNGDSNAENFGEIHKLLPHADYVEIRKGICVKCKSKSIYTMKIEENEKKIEIGDSNYIPLCRKCAVSLKKDRISSKEVVITERENISFRSC